MKDIYVQNAQSAIIARQASKKDEFNIIGYQAQCHTCQEVMVMMRSYVKVLELEQGPDANVGVYISGVSVHVCNCARVC